MNTWRTFVASLGLMAVMNSAHALPTPGQGTWESTLKARDINGNAVALDSASAAFFYDTTLNITWLAEMNHGRKSWADAKTWVDNLTVSGFSDWRLPTMKDTGQPGCVFAYSGSDCGYNVQTKDGSTVHSEMAHLFYVTLGNLSFADSAGNWPQSGWGLGNTAFFRNMQADLYWSGLQYTDTSSNAWYFNNNTGYQDGDIYPTSYAMYATAVRSGDVLAAIPEPQTYAMLLLGMSALMVVGKRRHR